jgi:hypothetical protein
MPLLSQNLTQAALFKGCGLDSKQLQEEEKVRMKSVIVGSKSGQETKNLISRQFIPHSILPGL